MRVTQRLAKLEELTSASNLATWKDLQPTDLVGALEGRISALEKGANVECDSQKQKSDHIAHSLACLESTCTDTFDNLKQRVHSLERRPRSLANRASDKWKGGKVARWQVESGRWKENLKWRGHTNQVLASLSTRAAELQGDLSDFMSNSEREVNQLYKSITQYLSMVSEHKKEVTHYVSLVSELWNVVSSNAQQCGSVQAEFRVQCGSVKQQVEEMSQDLKAWKTDYVSFYPEECWSRLGSMEENMQKVEETIC